MCGYNSTTMANTDVYVRNDDDQRYYHYLIRLAPPARLKTSSLSPINVLCSMSPVGSSCAVDSKLQHAPIIAEDLPRFPPPQSLVLLRYYTLRPPPVRDWIGYTTDVRSCCLWMFRPGARHITSCSYGVCFFSA